MMIEKEKALALAADCQKAAGKKKYSFDSCDFLEERTGRYAAPARWIVRYTKPPSKDGSVTDDGDQLFVVRIEIESGKVSSSCGFPRDT